MTDDTKPTPGNEGGKTTTTPNGGKPDITPEVQAIIDKAVTDRLAREKKAHEKSTAELEAKIQEYEQKNLTDSEKAKAAQAKRDKELADKEQALAGKELLLAKREALLAAGVDPKKISDVVTRIQIQGTTPEEIAADIEALKASGLIQISPPIAAQGAGNNGVPMTPGRKVWTKDEVLNLQKDNPAEYVKHRQEILEQMGKGLLK